MSKNQVAQKNRWQQLSRLRKWLLYPPHSQNLLKSHTERRGTVILQPPAKLCKRYSLIRSSTVVQVESDIPFFIPIPNFWAVWERVFWVKWWLPWCQAQRKSCLVVTLAEVLDAAEKKTTSPKSSSKDAPAVMPSLPSAAPFADIALVHDLDLSRPWPKQQNLVREMSGQFDSS